MRVQDVTGMRIGGTAAGDGNVISGNEDNGIETVLTVDDLTIQGNLIGLAPSGTAAMPNGIGINLIATTTDTQIGGTVAGAGNFIAGNSGDGVVLGGSDRSVLEGNTIGLGTDGVARPNARGIWVGVGGDLARIGGTAAGRPQRDLRQLELRCPARPGQHERDGPGQLHRPRRRRQHRAPEPVERHPASTSRRARRSAARRAGARNVISGNAGRAW